MKPLLYLVLLFQCNCLHATIWSVGPSRFYQAPSAVSALVADGDTVEIDAGLYSGDVTKWFANRLLIRSLGNGYAHLEAAGNYAEGKGIWVIKGADCTVEGIEFSGCQVPDHNGAGIRQEGKNLTLRHCYFHHNEMGILTSNDGVSDFLFESCEFAFNGFGDGFSHNIYVGSVNSLTMQYCYSHDAHVGHLVKSRARYNRLYYNRLTGENGDGSYEVDMPNGGQAILIGNLIEQSPNSQNGGMITLGLENQNHPEQQIVLVHNTIVNDRFDGRFVQCSNATTLVKMVNNLILGPGTFFQGPVAALDTSHNIRLLNVAEAVLSDPANFEYRPLAGSPCINAGIDPGNFNNEPLMALFAYQHPLGHTARWISGTAPEVGAYEFLMVPYRWVEAEDTGSGFSVFPNPLASGAVLNVLPAAPHTPDTEAFLYDLSGKLIWKGSLNGVQGKVSLHLPEVPAGSYFLYVAGLGRAKPIRIN